MTDFFLFKRFSICILRINIIINNLQITNYCKMKTKDAIIAEKSRISINMMTVVKNKCLKLITTVSFLCSLYYFFALMQTSNDFKILFKHYCINFQILIQNAAAVELSFTIYIITIFYLPCFFVLIVIVYVLFSQYVFLLCLL